MNRKERRADEFKFKLDSLPDDFGKLIYEFDDTDTMYDTSEAKRKAMRKSPAAIIMLCILAFLVGWFIYSLTAMIVREGFMVAVLSHLSGFFLLFVAGLIIILSAFGLWGKFTRFAFRHNLARGHDAAERRQLEALKEEMEEKDARRIVRNAISIYEHYIVIVNMGEVKAYDRSRLKGVRMRNYGNGKKVVFASELGESVYADAVLTFDAAREIRRIFKNEYISPKKYKASLKAYEKSIKSSHPKTKTHRVKSSWHCDKSVGALIGLTFFMFVPMGAGAGVIALHYYVSAQIPVFLGIFFIMGGFVGLCTVYSFVPLIKSFLIPFTFGALLSVAPMGLLGAIYDNTGIVFSLESVLGFFSPLTAGFVFLTLIGILILLYSFYELYKFIRYGE